MPVFQTNQSPAISIWKITETWQDMLELFQNKALYVDDVCKIQSDKRKCEWLAVRLLLKKLTGKEMLIGYKENGKPFLENNFYNISISHTKGYAAIILTEHTNPGIDIEYRSDRAWKLRRKFLSTEELKLLNPDPRALATICWCAKETAYKALQENEVDFINHLHIAPFTYSTKGVFFLNESKTQKQETYAIHYQVTDEFVITRKE